MSGPVRVGAFVLVLAALFAAAAAVGGAVGPLDRGVAAEEEHGEDEPAATDGPAGLAVAAGGLRLDVVRDRPPLAFRILRDDGTTLRDFDVEHERRMHLIVVRRDLSEFRHVHPEEREGVWDVRIPLAEPGAYRAFADFAAGGEKRTLGVDLDVPGRYAPRPLPAPAREARVDGYAVRLDPHARAAGAEAALEFTVRRDGREVRVQPYLGARGHLVVLREGDLAYLHNHADEDALRFETTFPSAGRYRAFLQFRHAGAVRTAAFTVEVPR